ncbi:EamA family transporter [Amycolatopsis sp. NEAU-NG30]|uniref:EamA family transporter n=1 Tax=Amycolatopsis melonis TaxID=3156488 RepID=A0ABV0LEI8_9PSEU
MRTPAPLLMLASVVSLEGGQAFGKTLFTQVSPAGVVSLRLGLAAALLLAVRRPPLPRGRREVLHAAAFGTAIAGMNLIYPALRFLPVGPAGTIQQLGPLAIAVATSRRPRDLGFVLLAGVGLCLVHNPAGTGLPAAGVALAAASAGSMAAYLLLSKGAASVDALAYALVWGALLWAPAGIAGNGAALLRPPVLLAGLAVAVLTAVLPYSLEFAALRRAPTRVVSALAGLEPAVAAVAGVVVLHEFLSLPAWLGVGCVVTAAVAISGQSRREPQLGADGVLVPERPPVGEPARRADPVDVDNVHPQAGARRGR